MEDDIYDEVASEDEFSLSDENREDDTDEFSLSGENTVKKKEKYQRVNLQIGGGKWCCPKFRCRVGIPHLLTLKHVSFMEQKKYSKRRELRKHYEMSHPKEKQFFCGIGQCTRSFQNRPYTNAHRQIHKYGYLPCPHCPYQKAITWNIFQKHRAQCGPVEQRTNLKCNSVKCPETFFTRLSRANHESAAHAYPRKLYKCDTCDASYRTVRS